MADSGFIVPPLSQYVTLAILSLCWFCSKALLRMGFAVQLLQWRVLPWADTVSVGDRDLLWDVPMQTCLLSCACSAIGVCTSALCSGKPLLLLECSPSCRYRQWRLWITGVGTSWQMQMSLQVTEFPQDRYYLPAVYFSSLGKLIHSLKFVVFPGKMLQDEKQSCLPSVTPQTLSFGFAE